MPSHIYIRVGRYGDAAEANRRAIVADDAYVTQCHAQGLYPLAYMPHNHHFLWAAATFEGDSRTALASARHIAHHVDRELLRAPGYGTLQHFLVTPLYALVRFGRWDEVLAYPRPDEDLLYPEGVWRYARGLALIRKGRLDEAEAELARLRQIAANPVLDTVTLWDINGTADLLEIATEVVAGELAATRGDDDEAVRCLEVALELESTLLYDEPPAWHQPVRQVLAALLLEAGRAEDAERVYRDDLAKFPRNGWSLFGLAQALEAQGRADEAAEVRERFRAVWSEADLTLAASRF
jgi:tetratricopeptide (TPR) repeat protein